MASLPPIKRISKEDIPEAPPWIEKVIYPVNLFFDSVYRALNGRLTSPENISAEVKEINFQVPSSYDGTTVSDWDILTFQSSIGRLAKSLQVMQIIEVVNTGNFAPIGKDITIDWEDENRLIKIHYITGLTASKKYKLRVKIE